MTISEQSPQADGALDATHRHEHEPGREHDHAHATLAVNSAGIVLAGLGFINPLVAAFIHVSSELVFILNSTRMLPVGIVTSVTADLRPAIPACCVNGKRR